MIDRVNASSSVRPPGQLALRRAMPAQHLAGKALGDVQMTLHMLDASLAASGACRIWLDFQINPWLHDALISSR